VDRGGSREHVYAIHDGERVKLEFGSKVGSCDYAIMHDEATGRWEDCGPPINSQFEWRHDFAGEKGGLGRRRISVTGYTIQGRRDAMPIRGVLVESPGEDEKDVAWAGASAWVELYQSELRMRISLPEGSPDWSLSKLTLRRRDGVESRVSLRSAGKSGFEVSGPDTDGAWEIVFHPSFDQVNSSGDSAAELSVADERGKTHHFDVQLFTP
jgi:hypothetical protein